MARTIALYLVGRQNYAHTHTSMTDYMTAKLVYGQKTVMPIERTIVSWVVIPWENEISREGLLSA